MYSADSLWLELAKDKGQMQCMHALPKLLAGEALVDAKDPDSPVKVECYKHTCTGGYITL